MKVVFAILTCCLFFLVSSAHAENVVLEEIPSNWRLENYVGGNIVVWWSSSSCQNGMMVLNGATEGEENRFWSLVMAAKVASKKMGVVYDNATTSCTIHSFFLDKDTGS